MEYVLAGGAEWRQVREPGRTVCPLCGPSPFPLRGAGRGPVLARRTAGQSRRVPGEPVLARCHVFPVSVEPSPAAFARAAVPARQPSLAPGSPACPPRTRAARAVSRQGLEPAHTCKETPPGHRPAPCMKVNGYAARHPRSGQSRPGPAETTLRYIAGTRQVQESQVHARYKRGPPQVHRTSRNSRVPLPHWHPIPGQRVKNGPSNPISVTAELAPRPGRGAPLPLRWRQGGRQQDQGRPCVQEATRREGSGVHRDGPAPAQR